MLTLLTTSQSFWLLDTDTGNAQLLSTGNGVYYGIAVHGDHIYVAARDRWVSSNVPKEEERGFILVFDRDLRPCGTLRAPFPLRDLHQIAWHDGKLYATCSFDNLVALYDGQRWEKWFPLNDKRSGDTNHFNSFLFEEDRVLILAHNWGLSEAMAFSVIDRRLCERVQIGNGGHNLWREEGRLYSCSSSDGVILSDRSFRHQTGGFPRGVAFDSVSRCIGISEVNERAERSLSTGRVLVRRRDWTPIHEIILPGEGLVLDLLQLPQGFSESAQDFRWPLLSPEFNIPRHLFTARAFKVHTWTAEQE